MCSDVIFETRLLTYSQKHRCKKVLEKIKTVKNVKKRSTNKKRFKTLNKKR